jgi:hypothetical protein
MGVVVAMLSRGIAGRVEGVDGIIYRVSSYR